MRNGKNKFAAVAILAILAIAESASAYYSPAMGRFLGRDPIDEPGAALTRQVARQKTGFIPRDPIPTEAEGNSYRFVDNSPSNYVDLLGMFRNYICCNQDQRHRIRQDASHALTQIQVLRQQISIAIAQDTGQYPVFTGMALSTSLRYLDKAVDVIQNYDVKCEPPGASQTCNNGAAAWVKWIFTQTVHLCPFYFEGYWGPNTRAACLVHEGTHVYGSLDLRYFWQNNEWPRRIGLTGWQDIASTYDTWILGGFCIPGYDCVGRPYVNETN